METLPECQNRGEVSRALTIDGIETIVRPISAGDAEAIQRFHNRLSVETIRRRYFTAHPELQADEVVHLTQVDGSDRVALVAERSGELIAVGRYDRLDDRIEAEVALVVADQFQLHGIGGILLHRLAMVAKMAGVTCFRAAALADNAAILSVFYKSGFPVESTAEWGTVELKISLASVSVLPANSQTGTCHCTRVPPEPEA